MNQAAEARTVFLKAKEAAEAVVKDAPDEPERHAQLARALARLGEKEAAIGEAKRALELRPGSTDAFEGPRIAATLAEVYAVAGENAKAIALLDHLLSVPSDLTVPFLKIDPTLDSLRDDPAFAQMLARH